MDTLVVIGSIFWEVQGEDDDDDDDDDFYAWNIHSTHVPPQSTKIANKLLWKVCWIAKRG